MNRTCERPRERPILFSGPMVRAILDGRKTQTRRIIPDFIGWKHGGVEGDGFEGGGGCYEALVNTEPQIKQFPSPTPFRRYRCRFGAVGDRLWVRESFYQWTGLDYLADGWAASPDGNPHRAIRYRADWEPKDPWEISVSLPKPSIHMPRWASRITLEITDIRIERLQDISPEDAQAEGIEVSRCGCEACTHTSAICPADGSAYIEAFAVLWDQINDAPGKRWADNPWLWVISFTPQTCTVATRAEEGR